ncbi:MAG TPA: type II secretion system protein N [Steroidobacteraceae bacterium]|jgi:general secretion pathway protein C
MLQILNISLRDWATLIARRGPWWVSLILAALIAVELVRILLALRPADLAHAAQPLAAASSVQARAEPRSIIEAHLFGLAMAGDTDPDRAPTSAANLVLAGTIATENPKRGIALIGDRGSSRVYSVGDRVGDALLHSVYLDRVVLQRGSALESLLLPRLLLSGRTMMATRTAEAAEGPPESRARAPRNTELLRLIGSFDSKAGKSGYHLFPGKNGKAFSNLGLRPGDLVTSINGTPLDDSQRAQQAMSALESSDNATITVQRGRLTQEIVLNMAPAVD